MSLFPDGMPMPQPNAEDAGFWAHCRKRRLCFQSCGDCGRVRHPPTPVCAACNSMRVTWRTAPAVGHIYSYSIAYHPTLDILRGRPPYVIALIIFAELDDARLVTNIIDAEPHQIEVGAAVELVWDEIANGMVLPRFRLLDQ